MFTRNKEEIKETHFQCRSVHRKTIQYLNDKEIHGNILDIGQRSPLTQKIEEEFNVKVDNTDGDLDGDFSIPKSDYDFIVFSHTLEHIFDPVHCLLKIKKVMKLDCKMFIMLPRRGKLLWCNNHYHEIDHFRFLALMERTGFDIIDWKHSKAWRLPVQYLKGFRSLYRLFREFNITYQVMRYTID